jgi:hypothetical protein
VIHAQHYLAEAMTQAAVEPENAGAFMKAHSTLTTVYLDKFLVKWNASGPSHEASTLQAMANLPTWANQAQLPPAEPAVTKSPDADTMAPM